MRHLPVFYHRSTIITIDDDKLISEALIVLLGETYNVKSFSQSRTLLDYIDKHESQLPDYIKPHECMDHEYFDTAGHMPIDYNISGLYTLLNDPKRSDEISVIIIDYNMPDMNGLDLCNLLKKNPAKKILLTGETDYQTAVNAFNNNLIDKFIRKDSPSLAIELLDSVASLTNEYYQQVTSSILAHLETSKLSVLSDSSFVSFFNTWIADNSIKEYTLIDKNGSLCVKDGEGKLSYLIIHTDNSLNSFIEINEDEVGAAAFLDSIAKREMIPFFGIGSEYWSIEASSWPTYFHKANILVGKENYYWAHVA